MQESRYARKQKLKQFARGFSDFQWEKLCGDEQFVRHMTGDNPKFDLARERAEILFPELKPKPVVLKSLAALPAVKMTHDPQSELWQSQPR